MFAATAARSPAEREFSERFALGRSIRWCLYGSLIALAAAQATAQLFQSGPRYVPGRWPEARPADVPFFSANDRSRWCAIWSLTERGTHQIDEIINRPGWDTIDKVRLGDHFYSSKPPFVAVIGATVYRGVKAGLGYNLDRTPHQAAHAVLWLLNVVPWIAALVVLARLIDRHGQSDFSRLTTLMAASLATFVTPFLQTLNNHTPAVCCLIFSLAAVLWAQRSPDRWRPFALAGFWAATCACFELPAAVWGLTSCLLCLRANLRSTLLLFVPAALPSLTLFLMTNSEATGSWLPAYASFGSAENNPYHYVVGGVPSYWLNPSVIDRGESSGWWYLFHCVLGHHGIFSLSPLFLVTLAGWLWWPRTEPPATRLIQRLGLGLTVWVLGFYLRQTSSWNYGGVSCCLRWALWLVPLWLMGLLAPLDRWGRGAALRWLTAALLGLSFYSASIPRDNPWQLPWLQTSWEHWFPRPTDGSAPTSHSSWIARLPRWPEGANSVVAGYAAELPDGGSEEFTLTFPRPEGECRPRVLVTGAAPGLAGRWLESETALEVDLSSLPAPQESKESGNHGAAMASAMGNAGEAPKGPTPAGRFLLGLPWVAQTPKPQYRWGSTRYLKTPLYGDAVACRLLSASVLLPAQGGRGPMRSRRVVWWADELPWGAVQIEDTLTDAVDNTILSRRRYQLVSHSPPLIALPNPPADGPPNQ